MGLVLAGFDAHLERDVALKRPRRGDAQGALRLWHEARLTARLEHPGICGIHDVFVDDDGAPVAVLEIRPGRNLDRVFDDDSAGELPCPRLLRILLSACRAMAHAHERGVFHRDLSPSNIRVGDDDATSIIDWGLAASVDEARALRGRAGTPGYAAPELQRGEGSTPASDVWSLGALLRRACGGRPAQGAWPRSDVGPAGVDACLLHGGLVAGAASGAVGQPGVAAATSATTQLPPVAVGNGTPVVRCDRSRRTATALFTERFVVVDGRNGVLVMSPAIAPCSLHQPIRAAIPTGDGGAVVHCGDASFVAVDVDGSVRPLFHDVEGVPRRALSTSALLDDQHVVVGSTHSSVTAIDLASAEVTREAQLGGQGISELVALTPSRVVAVSGRQVHLVDMELGVAWPMVTGPSRDIVTGVSGDGEQVSVLRGPVVQHLRLPPTGTRVSVATSPHGRSAIAVDDESGVVYVGDGGGHVDAYDVRTGAHHVVDAGPHRVIKSLALSPSRKLLAVGAAGPDGLFIVDTATGRRRSWADPTRTEGCAADGSPFSTTLTCSSPPMARPCGHTRPSWCPHGFSRAHRIAVSWCHGDRRHRHRRRAP